MGQAFDGIEQKLKRADENIRNLNREIKRFFKKGKYPILPHKNKQVLLQAIAYHRERRIPLRLSVLVGEIVHHLRSCLDHVVWLFSSEAYRRTGYWKIEFPVFETRPVDKDRIARYEGKVKGISNLTVLRLIEGLQPYNRLGTDSPLLILHNMDIIDKHRELVLCFSSGRLEISKGVLNPYLARHPDISAADLAVKLKDYGKVVPQISFRNFGGREVQPVVPGLYELLSFVKEQVRIFRMIK